MEIKLTKKLQNLIDEHEGDAPVPTDELGQLFLDKFFTPVFEIVDNNSYRNPVHYSKQLDMILIEFVSGGDFLEAIGVLKDELISKIPQ